MADGQPDVGTVTLDQFTKMVATEMCGIVSAALVVAVNYTPDGQMEMHSAFRGRPDVSTVQHVELRAFFAALQEAIKANMQILDPSGGGTVTSDYLSPPPTSTAKG